MAPEDNEVKRKRAIYDKVQIQDKDKVINIFYIGIPFDNSKHESSC